MKTSTRWAVLGLVVAVAVVAFVIAQSSGGSKTNGAQVPVTGKPATATTTPARFKTIVVKGGKPVGGIQDINVKKGQPVRFTIQSDVADEIHVHGYDYHKDVAKNGSVSFSFPATIDGGFVIELESRREQIAALKVQP